MREDSATCGFGGLDPLTAHARSRIKQIGRLAKWLGVLAGSELEGMRSWDDWVPEWLEVEALAGNCGPVCLADLGEFLLGRDDLRWN